MFESMGVLVGCEAGCETTFGTGAIIVLENTFKSRLFDAGHLGVFDY